MSTNDNQTVKKKVKLAYKNIIKAFFPNKNMIIYTNRSDINKKVDALAITNIVI